MGSLISCHIIVSDLQAIKTVEGENRRGRGRWGAMRGAGQSRQGEGLQAGHGSGVKGRREEGRRFRRTAASAFLIFLCGKT